MAHNTIDGNPTKKFFIEMITRDISIEDAIIDLLDNSIDGANNINPNDYSGLEIELSVNSNEFSIRDNCGGFSLETAQKYAFIIRQLAVPGNDIDKPNRNGALLRIIIILFI